MKLPRVQFLWKKNLIISSHATSTNYRPLAKLNRTRDVDYALRPNRINSSERGINMEHGETSRRRASSPFNYTRYWILIGKGLINPLTILRTRNVRRCSSFIKFYFHPDRDMEYFRNSARLWREYFFFNENVARRYFDEWKWYIFL